MTEMDYGSESHNVTTECNNLRSKGMSKFEKVPCKTDESTDSEGNICDD